ncbi:MAG: class I SAM-dependent methyltransferase [Candidatus Omnitrophica bacterium]|nr:class I SAM-dependent methyltransferase [Candidatus Omnitrophota bacterium]
MSTGVNKKLIERGLGVADFKTFEADKIWSRYSNDKVVIGEGLGRVIRVLSKTLPLAKPLTALSIGSSNEPQFRILETAFRGGLYLLDIEEEALDIVKERIRRQWTDHVSTIRGNFNKIFLDKKNTVRFLKAKLGGRKMNLVTLHHSMYYCDESKWMALFENLYRKILAPQSAVHAVLMASNSSDDCTTTWLYNHFVGKFFGLGNNQNLREFKRGLERNSIFSGAKTFLKSHHVRFFVDDFEKFMAVVWMILLYPDAHKYSLRQREEITEFVYRKFWKPRRPLIQIQDHLALYRGLRTSARII